MKAKKVRGQKSLDQFLLAQKRTVCRLCALPPVVLHQVETRNKHRVTVPILLAWLKEEYGVTISRKEYTLHACGGHTRIK